MAIALTVFTQRPTIEDRQVLNQERTEAMRGVRVGCGVFSAVAILLGLTPGANAVARAGHNGRVVFTTNRDGNPELYTLRSSGSAQTRLTNNQNADQNGDWSVAGVIAFDRDSGDRTDLWEFYPSTRSKKQLTSAVPGERNREPSWAPAGGRLVYTSNRSGNDDIYLLSVILETNKNLTNDPAQDTEPDWSPDGARIAFVSDRTGNPDIWVMSADGTGATDLTNTPDAESNPTWSPDGGQLAFARTQSGNADIWTMDASGGNPRRLTTDLDQDVQPVWSPDGRRIAFASRQDGNFEIYVMFADGTYQLDYSNSRLADDTQPNWEMVFSSAATVRGAPVVFDPQTGGCTMQGGSKPNRLIGGPNPEIICGLGGPDYIDGRGSNDMLLGGAGNDVINARDGQQDEIYGESGRDTALVDPQDVVVGVEVKKVKR